MTAPVLLHPSSESVAVAWLSALLPVGVATRLPKMGTWSVYNGTIQGFGTVAIVGGTTREVALRAPIVSLGTWANVPGSDNPQWGAAAQLAEILTNALLDGPIDPVRVSSGAKYADALVHTAKLNAEPRRVPDQDESVAHFETEFVLVWTEVPS